MVPTNNYTLKFTISNYDIIVLINYKVSVKNAYLYFNLIHSSKFEKPPDPSYRIIQNINITDPTDENNITVSEKYYNEPVSISLYSYQYLNEEQKENVKSLEKVQSGITTSIVISTSGLSIFQTLNVFWLMVDAMQIANFFLYLNVLYPSNLQTYLKILSSANLNFIPNPFSMGTKGNDLDANWKIFGDMIVDQEAPERFESLGKTSLFLKNSGLV